MQSELISTIKKVKNDMEVQEDRLEKKEKELSALEKEFNNVRKRGHATRAKATKMQDEAKKLEREKEQLQKEAKRMESEIHVLKKMQDLHAQSLEEASREKEELQNLIAEKERELKAAQDKLEMKEKELQEHKVEAERVGKRLEEVDREVPAELNILSEELIPQPLAESTVQRKTLEVPAELSEKLLPQPIVESAFQSGVQPPSNDCSEDPTAIVIDHGSGFIRSGFASDKAPTFVFSSVFGSHRLQDHKIDEEIRSKREILSLRYPIERGIITNWDDMENIWHHTFYNELRVDPTEQPTLLIESCFNQPNRDKMVEIMFETFNVPATYVTNSGPLSLFLSTRVTGVTVGIGHGVCSVVPVYGSYFLPHASFQQGIGGCDLTDYLARLLVQEGHAISVGMENAREIKEKLCYVVPNDQKADGVSKPHELQDGTIISVTEKCWYMCPEALFQPSILGMSTAGVHEMTYNSIMKCDEDIREEMFSNILLSGGSTLFPGFAERLQKEITALAPPTVTVRVITPAECLPAHMQYLNPSDNCWVGGSTFASFNPFQTMYIYKQDYEELGPSRSIMYKLKLGI